MPSTVYGLWSTVYGLRSTVYAGHSHHLLSLGLRSPPILRTPLHFESTDHLSTIVNSLDHMPQARELLVINVKPPLSDNLLFFSLLFPTISTASCCRFNNYLETIPYDTLKPNSQSNIQVTTPAPCPAKGRTEALVQATATVADNPTP